jgi:rhodanese-related sulfurtransferase
MKSVSVHELKEMLDRKEDLILINVREPFEAEEASMGGTLIPLVEIPSRVNEIPTDKKVIVHCRSGARSANAIGYLEQHYGFTNLYNLSGGILAWATEIDTSLDPF